ncbi:hypothetical protein GE061_012777 [Apolygus lucorum]|uniref:Uncharacterized protein n=1 Tax=Apolygus lucorum TaxID=248454 RepID=A0A8S9XVX4_APOLU|nr:hypothetical protein GE061_012777 [Apolygus lucorum]
MATTTMTAANGKEGAVDTNRGVEGAQWTPPVGRDRPRGTEVLTPSTWTYCDGNTEKFPGEKWKDKDESMDTMLTKLLTFHHQQWGGQAPPGLPIREEILDEPNGMRCKLNVNHDQGTRFIEPVCVPPDDPTGDEWEDTISIPGGSSYQYQSIKDRNREAKVTNGRRSTAAVKEEESCCVKGKKSAAMGNEAPVTAGTRTTTAGNNVMAGNNDEFDCRVPHPYELAIPLAVMDQLRLTANGADEFFDVAAALPEAARGRVILRARRGLWQNEKEKSKDKKKEPPTPKEKTHQMVTRQELLCRLRRWENLVVNA